MEYNETVDAVRGIIKKYRVKMTLRQIYYRLVAAQLIDNNLNQYKSLSRVLVKARETGDLPDDCMEDRARTSSGGDYGNSDPDEFIRRRVESLLTAHHGYTREMWADQNEYVEVWVEKDALSRIVSEAAGRYRVRSCVGRGYSSYTYVKDAVDRFVSMSDKEQCTVIYLGDHDPSGLDITRDLGRRLHEYGADHVTIERVALNRAQIDKYRLPPAPVKTTDARADAFIAKYGSDVVELDALEPPVLKEIIESTIMSHIDIDAWNATADRIDEEKDYIRGRMAAIHESLGLTE